MIGKPVQFELKFAAFRANDQKCLVYPTDGRKALTHIVYSYILHQDTTLRSRLSYNGLTISIRR